MYMWVCLRMFGICLHFTGRQCSNYRGGMIPPTAAVDPHVIHGVEGLGAIGASMLSPHCFFSFDHCKMVKLRHSACFAWKRPGNGTGLFSLEIWLAAKV